jgi:hypothetical protein
MPTTVIIIVQNILSSSIDLYSLVFHSMVPLHLELGAKTHRSEHISEFLHLV